MTKERERERSAKRVDEVVRRSSRWGSGGGGPQRQQEQAIMPCDYDRPGHGDDRVEMGGGEWRVPTIASH